MSNCCSIHFRFYTQKRITGKNIPLPKIGSFDSPNLSGNNVLNNNHATQAQNNHAPITTISNGSDNNSNIKNSINNNSISNTNNQLNNNQANGALNNVLSPTDEKNSEFYAVTEL